MPYELKTTEYVLRNLEFTENLFAVKKNESLSLDRLKYDIYVLRD